MGYQKILTIILYPYFWMGRMVNRSVAFLRSKKDPNSALEPAERDFVETIPGFFILSGIFIGIYTIINTNDSMNIGVDWVGAKP